MPIRRVELLRALHRVLAGHGVGDVEHLARLAPAPSAPAARPSARRRCAAGRRCPRSGSRGRRRAPRRGRSAGSRAGSSRPAGWWTLRPVWRRPACAAARARPAGRRRWRRAADGAPPSPASAPSLAEVVVLPEPCRPVIRTTEGSRDEVWRRGGSSPPSSATISSRTTRITAWAGVRLLQHLLARGRTRTRSRNCLTTLKWTSASSRARRISRSAASTSASVRDPWPRRVRNTPSSLSLRASNTAAKSSRQRRSAQSTAHPCHRLKAK